MPTVSTEPKWECAWHPVHRRYYFQDPVTGKSTWLRPQGCKIPLPSKPPADANVPPPRPPDDVPPSWAAAFDPRSRKYYYYKVAHPEERTWFKPILTAKEKKQLAAETTTASAVRLPSRSMSGVLKAKTSQYILNHWEAESFRTRVEELRAAGDVRYLRSAMMELVRSNNTLVSAAANMMPRTVPVNAEECLAAVRERQVEDYGLAPNITISSHTPAEAAYFFGSQDPRRVVCVVNCADGQRPGGGYISGLQGPEEDLCRRLHVLHGSLERAERAGLYPFGPSTCQQREVPAKYADVLFTPEVHISRGPEEEGFRILPDANRVPVWVVSAAPPDAAERKDLVDLDLLKSSVLSMFVAPVLKEPRVTTLVIGAWGVGAQGNDATEVADILVRAIANDLPQDEICLGRLYHEIHFAIPHGEWHPGNTLEVFRRTLQQHDVSFSTL